MSQQASTKLIGAFVIGAVVLMIATVLVLGRGALFRNTVPVVMFFDGDVQGLPVGAPIAFRGVKVGQITRIRIQGESAGKIAVYGWVDEKQLPGEDPERALRGLIQEGLRAQLGQQSLVSGQFYVSLSLLPTTTPTRYGFDPSAFEIPTLPSPIQQVTERGLGLMAKLESLDLEKLVAAAAAAAEGIDRRVRSAEVAQALQSVTTFFVDADRLARQAAPVLASFQATSDTSRQGIAETAQALQRLASSLEKTSDGAQMLLASVGAKVDPFVATVMGTAEQLRAAAEKAHGTLEGVDGVLGGGSPLGQQLRVAIRELTGASRSIRILADYLERHPAALVWGKGRAGS